jgi:hypothetical protein
VAEIKLKPMGKGGYLADHLFLPYCGLAALLVVQQAFRALNGSGFSTHVEIR